MHDADQTVFPVSHIKETFSLVIATRRHLSETSPGKTFENDAGCDSLSLTFHVAMWPGC